jgi:hypothetical protein
MRVPVGGGEPFQLAKNANVVLAFSDGSDIYSSNTLTNVVSKYDVETGAVTVIAAGQEDARAVVSDGPNLYWIRGNDNAADGPSPNEIVTMPKAGGSAQVVFTATHQMESLSVSGDALFYSDSLDVYRVPKNGGKSVLLVSREQVVLASPTVSGSYIYGIGGDAIYRVPISGGMYEKVAATGSNFVDAILADDVALYIAGQKSIDRVALDGSGKLETIVPSPTSHHYDITMNDRFLYFWQSNRVVRMPKSVK